MIHGSRKILSALYRYPVKSMRGEQASSLKVDKRGFEFDRRWMLVDPSGRFLSQRQVPRMSLLQPGFQKGSLVISTADARQNHQASYVVAGRCDEAMETLGEPMQVTIWEDTCQAIAPDKQADQWLSDFLAVDCRLVYLPPGATRQVDQQYAQTEDELGFADGFPFLLISQASLDDLNQRLIKGGNAPVPMQRFRPNLVVTGTTPYQEDNWRKIRIGDMIFRVVKPCSRCIITTIDPETAERTSEPLATLSQYRKQGHVIYFGQNLIHQANEGDLGILCEGAEVELLE